MRNSLFDTLKKIAENQGSPYKSIKLLGTTLTIVLNDGQIITKHDATKDDYYKVLDAKTKIEIKQNANTSESITMEDIEVVTCSFKTMKKSIKNRVNKI